jgi:hypothetical protein
MEVKTITKLFLWKCKFLLLLLLLLALQPWAGLSLLQESLEM